MTHLYRRDVEHGLASSLHTIAEWIAGAPGDVLDIGMGAGSLGRLLRQHMQVEVCLDGITRNPQEILAAEGFYRDCRAADLNLTLPSQVLSRRSYRWVVCADVLEHLVEPRRILDDVRRLLAPDGELLISLPNVGYAGLVAELLQGHWRYREEGLLDQTHLRFFAYRSLASWLQNSQWTIRESRPIRLPLQHSEFRPTWELLPEGLARHLLRRPHASTYQFVLRCKPVQGPGEVALLEAQDDDSASPGYAIELYLDDGSGFRESLKAWAEGRLGSLRQTVQLAIPPAPDRTRAYRGARLDPSDRAGLILLHAVNLFVGYEQAAAWTWQAHMPDALEQLRGWLGGNAVLASTTLLTSEAILLLGGDDVWIHLPWPAHLLDRLSLGGGRVEVILGAAASLDGLALYRQLEELPAPPRDDSSHIMQQEIERLRRLNRQLELALQTQHQAMLAHASPTGATAPFSSNFEMESKHDVLPLPSAISPSAAEPVAIIVPVYRGLEDTQRCLNSIVRARNRTPWRLVVVDDCSPEPELSQWLNTFAASQSPQTITLIRHDKNLGFVHSINDGLRVVTGQDVVLLNSDTEVTDGWLDRLRKACHRESRIGTATPWSNHATIFSYPCWPDGGDLPVGWSPHQIAALCAQWLDGQTIDVPTGHGFCLYIKAACLADSGPFDAEAFGLGYGEENDFCLRAAKLGWRHVHALDTYVYHRGSVSFGAQRDQRVQQAMRIIRNRYPAYESEVQRLVLADPWERARRLLDLARLADPNRARILLVSHDGAGGTQRHQFELAAAFADKATFLRLLPQPGGVAWYVVGGVTAPPQRWYYRMPDEYPDLVENLAALNIQLVHFHHWHGLSAELLQLGQALNVPYDITLHDHYAYCPQLHLTLDGTQYCGELGIQQCRDCVRRHPAPDGTDDIGAWRARHAAWLYAARHVIVPSRDLGTRVWRYFGIPAWLAYHDQLAPSGGGSWPQPTPIGRGECRLTPERRLRVVVIGALGHIKGADLLEATALLAARQSAPVEFHLLGYAYRNLLTVPKTALVCHGRFEDDELPALLRWLQADLVWLPSRVAESYSYTLSAALAAGLPVAATDLGALAERLHGRTWSWLLPLSAGPEEWLRLFVSIHRRWSQPDVTEEVPVAWSQYLSESNTPPLNELIYQRDYLPFRAPASFDPSNCVTQWMAQGRHRPPTTVVSRGRLWLLQRLIHWRAAPWLRPVARRIPLPWQRRIKRWLLR